MKHYNEIVPLSIAKALFDAGLACKSEKLYDKSTGKVCPAKASKAAGDDDKVPAPTYAQVLDTLFDKGFFIRLHPFPTMATKDFYGFECHLDYQTKKENKIKTIYIEEFASFHCCLNQAISEAIKLIRKSKP